MAKIIRNMGTTARNLMLDLPQLWLVLGILWYLFAPSSSHAQERLTTIQPNNPNIQFTGRWNFDAPDQPWVVWQGSTLLIRFNGTDIQAELVAEKNVQQFRVIVDGVPNMQRIYLNPGENLVNIAQNMSSGEHTIEIMKETFTASKTTFLGFKLSGKILTPPVRPALRIEWFGDSNMAGNSNYSEKNSGDMGTYYAYPAMVTRMLGAEMNLEAVGGATIEGKGDNNVGAFIYSENFRDQDPGYRSGFDPHLIVMNAGANDINRSDKPTIIQRYKNVVTALRSVYGSKPHIVLMNSYGWDVNEPANYTPDVVKEIGGNISVFLFPWLWEKWHGSQWDHSGQAHLLVEHVASVNPAWAQVNPADVADGFGRRGDFANGSFEHAAPFGGFGWRYRKDGVERIQDTQSASYGDFYIRLEEGEFVHQPTDATADFEGGGTAGVEVYTITADIRGITPNAQASFTSEFQGQQIWTRKGPQETIFDLTREWKEYAATSTAPPNTWTLFNTIKAVKGTIDVDNVRMSLTQIQNSRTE
ncbi:MAG TPA: hypothetical protein EYN96_13030 [Candidatus Hydrogenedentes bacterium]|nr:hypothetical protein [Candidatus Hydrogenedentota bacterium]